MTFTTGATTLCTTGPLVNGSGTCSAASAPVGTDTVTGTYSGDSTFAPSSGTTSLTVTGLAPTSVLLTASPNPIPPSTDSTTIGATIEDQTGNPMSGQTVRFSAQQGVLSASSATTGGSGTVHVVLSLGYTPATVTIDGVTACVGGVCGTVYVTFVGTGPVTKAAGGSSGYWIAGSDGGVFAFHAAYHGSMGGTPLNQPVVGITADPFTGGYWEVAADGGLFAFDAPFHGSMGGQHLNAPIVGMAYDPLTGGYWEVASDGGIFAFDAPFYGSMGATHLNAPIVGMAALPDGSGYYLVAADGGIFAFHAPFFGSMGGSHLNRPIVGMAIDNATGGYWFVASDGGLFAFHAPFLGSMGGQPLNQPIVGMAAVSDGSGYWEVASDGGLFAFNAPFDGSMGGQALNRPIVGMASS